MSPEYGHIGAYLLLRRKDSTTVSLNKTLQCALLCHTSSNSCLDQAPLSPMAEAEAAVAPVRHHFPAYPSGNPPDLNVGGLE